MPKPYYFTGPALVPNQVTLNGGYWDKDEIKKLAHSMFKTAGEGVNPFKIVDVNHDNKLIDAIIVESHLSKKDDTRYDEGTWVVTVEINDPAIVEHIRQNELNGFSIEFFRDSTDEYVLMSFVKKRLIETKPNKGHTHLVELVYDPETDLYYGQTSTNEGHSHSILNTTVTSTEHGHSHRFDFL